MSALSWSRVDGVSLVLSAPVHLVSQRPSTIRLYLCISLQICALFPVSYRFLMFQVTILVLALVVRRVVGALASRRFSPTRVMCSSRHDSSSTTLFRLMSLQFLKQATFYGTGLIAQPKPQPGGPVECASSGLYPPTCLAWVTLLGDEAPASIALGVKETHKPPTNGKVALLWGGRNNKFDLIMYCGTCI